MKVVPLAAESLGVRSMATYVEVARTGIVIDPGATLAPSRLNLPPADDEWDALRRANDRITAYTTRAEVLFISHYHEDHFRSEPSGYTGRTVLAKDPQRMVNGLQSRRAAELWAAVGNAGRLTPADGSELRTPAFTLRVSPPLPHGQEGTPLGHVAALTVVDHAERETFVFASDVQGPLSPVAMAYLIRERPTLLYVSGPPSYIERELGTPAIERGIDHLLTIIAATGCRVIMDHHALRDARWPTRFARLWDTGRVVTAAAHVGVATAPLECRRAALWGGARKPPVKAAAARATIRAPRSNTAKGGPRW